MNIDLVVVGRTNVPFVETGMEEYVRRLTRYVRFSVVTVPDIRGGGSLSETELRRREGEALAAVAISTRFSKRAGSCAAHSMA